VHALWTLEGLGALEPALVRALLLDASPRMRIHAARTAESLYKAGDRAIADAVKPLLRDADTEVVLQAMLTLNVLKVPEARDLITAAMAASTARGVQAVGKQMLAPPPAFGRGGRGGPAFTPDEIATMERGAAIYKELCFSCHGDDGRGTPQPGAPVGTLMAPSLVSSHRVTGHREYVIKTLLHGMQGAIDGRTYAGVVMAPMGTNRDEWIAAVASYIRNSFGNAAPIVTPGDVARVRTATASRRDLWTVDALLASLPQPLQAQPTWKATASHNAQRAAGAFSYAAWTTGAPQEPGMWFQIDLPEPATIGEIQFNSAGFGGARGRRGRGAAPASTQGAPSPPPAPTGTYPRAYKVEVSMDGATWSVVAEGEGKGAQTSIPFDPVRTKFLRLTQTARLDDAPPWSMQRLILYAPGK
jgi:mono/diheme cytochrome c family protein